MDSNNTMSMHSLMKSQSNCFHIYNRWEKKKMICYSHRETQEIRCKMCSRTNSKPNIKLLFLKFLSLVHPCVVPVKQTTTPPAAVCRYNNIKLLFLLCCFLFPSSPFSISVLSLNTKYAALSHKSANRIDNTM
jgi:hypothetical protein